MKPCAIVVLVALSIGWAGRLDLSKVQQSNAAAQENVAGVGNQFVPYPAAPLPPKTSRKGLRSNLPRLRMQDNFGKDKERSNEPLLRLDRLLAERGAGSRKDVDRLIRKGLVEIDGEVVAKSGAKLKVPFSTCPIVDGFDYPPPPLLAAYYKPLGVVSSMKDDHNRPDLSTVLPESWKSLHPVGRLDADTTGLLLFSRDGDLTHRLLHPKYIVEREYVAEVENLIDEADLAARLAEGIETIEDGESFVVQAKLLDVTGQNVRLSVTEGRHRMVRRILANAGHPVLALHRVRYGEVRLDDLGLDEGEATEIEGAALEWACSLSITGAAGASPRRARKAPRQENKGGSEEWPYAVGPVEDPKEAMRQAWVPKASDVRLVMEEAGVSKEEAVDALKRSDGDIVAALDELL